MSGRKTLREIQIGLAEYRAEQARPIEVANARWLKRENKRQEAFKQAHAQLKLEIEQEWFYWFDYGAGEFAFDGEGVSNPGEPFTVVFSSDVTGQFKVKIRLVEKPARHQRGWLFWRKKPHTEKGEILTKWLKGLGWRKLGVLTCEKRNLPEFIHELRFFELVKRFGTVTAVATVEETEHKQRLHGGYAQNPV